MDQKRFRIVLIGLAIAISIGLLTKVFLIPLMIRHFLTSMIHNACVSCTLTIGSVQLSLLPTTLKARQVEFKGGTPHATVTYAEASMVKIPFSPVSLILGPIRLGVIEVNQSKVKVVEGPLKVASSKEGPETEGRSFEIQGVQASNGWFVYEAEGRALNGVLTVSGIEANLGPIGTSPKFLRKKMAGHATGVLESSGTFLLNIEAFVFSPDPRVEVKLRISDQKLSDLNRFFQPSEGVQLEGDLIEGQTSVNVQDQKLTASVYALFRKFRVRIEATKDRSGISAFFQNLFTSLTLGKQNTKNEEYDRKGIVHIRRQPDQSLISFILTGMRDAALKVSEKGGG